MSKKLQVLCASSGFVLVALLSAGIIISGFIPPIPAHWSAEQVAAFYREHDTGIKIGMIFMLFGSAAIAPYAAMISLIIREIDSKLAPLASIQLICSACNIVAIFVPALIFLTAAYRPGRSPEITQTLNDMAWIPFIMNIPPAVLQGVVVGIAILSDKRQLPLMPRWTAYVNFWMAFLLMPAILLIFFKTGAFAWHGLISFYVAGAGYVGWFIVMSIAMLKYVNRKFETRSSDDAGEVRA